MLADDSASQPRRGRKRDPSRDEKIIQATLDVLAECGFEGATIEAVAARAGTGKATLYRRWASKEDLVLAAIASLGNPLGPDGLPDTGSLRSDLFAVIHSGWLGGPERRMAVLVGVSSVLTNSSPLAAAVHAQITQPYVNAYRTLLLRALDRGEIAPDTDVELLAELIPAISTHRLMFTSNPPDAPLLERVVDQVILPALAGRGA